MKFLNKFRQGRVATVAAFGAVVVAGTSAYATWVPPDFPEILQPFDFADASTDVMTYGAAMMGTVAALIVAFGIGWALVYKLRNAPT